MNINIRIQKIASSISSKKIAYSGFLDQTKEQRICDFSKDGKFNIKFCLPLKEDLSIDVIPFSALNTFKNMARSFWSNFTNKHKDILPLFKNIEFDAIADEYLEYTIADAKEGLIYSISGQVKDKNAKEQLHKFLLENDFQLEIW